MLILKKRKKENLKGAPTFKKLEYRGLNAGLIPYLCVLSDFVVKGGLGKLSK